MRLGLALRNALAVERTSQPWEKFCGGEVDGHSESSVITSQPRSHATGAVENRQKCSALIQGNGKLKGPFGAICTHVTKRRSSRYIYGQVGGGCVTAPDGRQSHNKPAKPQQPQNVVDVANQRTVSNFQFGYIEFWKFRILGNLGRPPSKGQLRHYRQSVPFLVRLGVQTSVFKHSMEALVCSNFLTSNACIPRCTVAESSEQQLTTG